MSKPLNPTPTLCPFCKTGPFLTKQFENNLYEKFCPLCGSTISNCFDLNQKNPGPEESRLGYGSFHFKKEDFISTTFETFRKFYTPESFLTDWMPQFFDEFKAEYNINKETAFAYTFNPETQTGQVIWGNGELLTLETHLKRLAQENSPQ